MRAADKVALLTALIDAASVELGKAKGEALALSEAVGADRFETPYGKVTVGQSDPKPAITDEPGFLRWVQAQHPTEVEHKVRDAFRDVVAKRLVVVAGAVVDSKTGEAVEWAEVKPAGKPYITWPASVEQRATKDEARAWFTGRADQMLEGMQAIAAGVEDATASKGATT